MGPGIDLQAQGRGRLRRAWDLTLCTCFHCIPTVVGSKEPRGAKWALSVMCLPAAAAAAAAAAAKSLQLCPTLCNPVDGSSPDSPVPEILQARTLERVAISFSNA